MDVGVDFPTWVGATNARVQTLPDRTYFFGLFGIGLVASETAFAASSAPAPGGVAGAASPPPHPTPDTTRYNEKTVVISFEHHGAEQHIAIPQALHNR